MFIKVFEYSYVSVLPKVKGNKRMQKHIKNEKRRQFSNATVCVALVIVNVGQQRDTENLRELSMRSFKLLWNCFTNACITFGK